MRPGVRRCSAAFEKRSADSKIVVFEQETKSGVGETANPRNLLQRGKAIRVYSCQFVIKILKSVKKNILTVVGVLFKKGVPT
jgi:hypothetical protein